MRMQIRNTAWESGNNKFFGGRGEIWYLDWYLGPPGYQALITYEHVRSQMTCCSSAFLFAIFAERRSKKMMNSFRHNGGTKIESFQHFFIPNILPVKQCCGFKKYLFRIRVQSFKKFMISSGPGPILYDTLTLFGLFFLPPWYQALIIYEYVLS